MSKDKTERKSGLAIAGFILAILAILGSWMPLINNVSFFFAFIALLFGVIGFVNIKKGKRVGQGLAVATIVLSVIAGSVVLATQAFYGKVANDIGSSVKKSVDDFDGTNTKKLLETSVDVTIGKFTAKTENYMDTTELPVTVKNKLSEKASYTVKIEAVDSAGTRLAEDTIYVTDLGAGQSVSETAFKYVESGKLAALKTATFKVLEIGKS